MSNDSIWQDDQGNRVRINEDGSLTTVGSASRVGQLVAVTGWGYTTNATVTAATDSEITVSHPDKGSMVFTPRRDGSWTQKGFATTYAPVMRASWL